MMRGIRTNNRSIHTVNPTLPTNTHKAIKVTRVITRVTNIRIEVGVVEVGVVEGVGEGVWQWAGGGVLLCQHGC